MAGDLPAVGLPDRIHDLDARRGGWWTAGRIRRSNLRPWAPAESPLIDDLQTLEIFCPARALRSTDMAGFNVDARFGVKSLYKRLHLRVQFHITKYEVSQRLKYKREAVSTAPPG